MGTQSIKGTEIAVGMVRYLGYKESSEVLIVEQHQHQLGARYALVTLSNGQQEKCWEGFLYRVMA